MALLPTVPTSYIIDVDLEDDKIWSRLTAEFIFVTIFGICVKAEFGGAFDSPTFPIECVEVAESRVILY